MVNPDDDDLARAFTKSVQHTVGTATGRPDAGKVTAQRFTDTPRLRHKRGGEEIDDRSSNRFGKPVSDCAAGGRSKDELVSFLLGQRTRLRTASIPRTTSPRT